MLKKLIILSALSVFISDLKADYYDRCNAILAKGVYNTYIQTGDSKSKVNLKKWLCSSFEGSTSRAGGGKFEVDVFDIFSSGMETNSQNADQWKRSHCTSDDYAYEGSKASHLLIQDVNKDVVNAWKECVTKDEESKGLTCYVKEQDQALILTASVKYGIGDVKNIKFEFLNLQKNSSELFETIRQGGEKRLILRKNDLSQESILSLNGTADYLDVGCDYVIGIKPDYALDNPCERARLDAYSKGKILQETVVTLRKLNMAPLIDKSDNVVGYSFCKYFN